MSFVKTNASHAGVTTRWASDEQAELRVEQMRVESPDADEPEDEDEFDPDELVSNECPEVPTE